jgi:hypothetical protein
MMHWGEVQAVDFLEAANVFANGAILVDEYDKEIFDDLYRNYPVWSWIDKRLAPGDFTNGFQQTATGAARAADKRSLAYSATSPTRSARTPREIKAITRDLTFGMYDRSVYAQQGRRYGDLTAKDVSDMYTSMLALWSDLFWTGDSTNPLHFDGIIKILGGSVLAITAAQSVVRKLQEQVVTMMNTTVRDVRPNGIILNARIRQIISQEYLFVGDKLPTVSGTKGEQIAALDTAAGFLPLIVDNFASAIAATPTKYKALITESQNMVWEYVEPLGESGADPKVFEIAQTNVLDTQNKGVMFGALEPYGTTNHHQYVTVEDRTTVISPVA